MTRIGLMRGVPLGWILCVAGVFLFGLCCSVGGESAGVSDSFGAGPGGQGEGDAPWMGPWEDEFRAACLPLLPDRLQDLVFSRRVLDELSNVSMRLRFGVPPGDHVRPTDIWGIPSLLLGSWGAEEPKDVAQGFGFSSPHKRWQHWEDAFKGLGGVSWGRSSSNGEGMPFVVKDRGSGGDTEWVSEEGDGVNENEIGGAGQESQGGEAQEKRPLILTLDRMLCSSVLQGCLVNVRLVAFDIASGVDPSSSSSSSSSSASSAYSATLNAMEAAEVAPVADGAISLQGILFNAVPENRDLKWKGEEGPAIFGKMCLTSRKIKVRHEWKDASHTRLVRVLMSYRPALVSLRTLREGAGTGAPWTVWKVAQGAKTGGGEGGAASGDSSSTPTVAGAVGIAEVLKIENALEDSEAAAALAAAAREDAAASAAAAAKDGGGSSGGGLVSFFKGLFGGKGKEEGEGKAGADGVASASIKWVQRTLVVKPSTVEPIWFQAAGREDEMEMDFSGVNAAAGGSSLDEYHPVKDATTNFIQPSKRYDSALWATTNYVLTRIQELGQVRGGGPDQLRSQKQKSFSHWLFGLWGYTFPPVETVLDPVTLIWNQTGDAQGVAVEGSISFTPVCYSTEADKNRWAMVRSHVDPYRVLTVTEAYQESQGNISDLFSGPQVLPVPVFQPIPRSVLRPSGGRPKVMNQETSSVVLIATVRVNSPGREGTQGSGSGREGPGGRRSKWSSFLFSRHSPEPNFPLGFACPSGRVCKDWVLLSLEGEYNRSSGEVALLGCWKYARDGGSEATSASSSATKGAGEGEDEGLAGKAGSSGSGGGAEVPMPGMPKFPFPKCGVAVRLQFPIERPLVFSNMGMLLKGRIWAVGSPPEDSEAAEINEWSRDVVNPGYTFSRSYSSSFAFGDILTPLMSLCMWAVGLAAVALQIQSVMRSPYIATLVSPLLLLHMLLGSLVPLLGCLFSPIGNVISAASVPFLRGQKHNCQVLVVLQHLADVAAVLALSFFVAVRVRQRLALGGVREYQMSSIEADGSSDALVPGEAERGRGESLSPSGDEREGDVRRRGGAPRETAAVTEAMQRGPSRSRLDAPLASWTAFPPVSSNKFKYEVAPLLAFYTGVVILGVIAPRWMDSYVGRDFGRGRPLSFPAWDFMIIAGRVLRASFLLPQLLAALQDSRFFLGVHAAFAVGVSAYHFYSISPTFVFSTHYFAGMPSHREREFQTLLQALGFCFALGFIYKQHQQLRSGAFSR